MVTRGDALGVEAGGNEGQFFDVGVDVAGDDDRSVMGCRVEAGDADALAPELFQLGDARAGENDQVVFVFHRGDEHDVVPLNRRLDHGADIDDRRIAADQRLGRHLAAAKQDRLDFQAIFVEQPHLAGDPDVTLAKA